MLKQSQCRRLVFTSAFLLTIVLSPVGSQASEIVVQYQPSNAKLTNPERGFYAQITARSEKRPLSKQRIAELREQGITLILRMYYLKMFRDKPLSTLQLNLIKQDFATLRAAGSKCIVRFAYSSRINEPDAPLNVVMQHIDQLEPLLRDNADVIAVLHTGFIGPWGEMHGSTHGLDQPKPMRMINRRLLEIMPTSRGVQVRTPLLKQTCLGAAQPISSDTAFSLVAASRIGHFNDCFLADETDLGTYEESQINAQKRYLALDTRFVPMGGETCRPSKFASISNARAEFAKMHWTYLHIDYHPKVIDSWRQQNFLDEVEQKLGYRLSLVTSQCSSEVTRKGVCHLALQMKNSGWAAPINPRDVLVIARHSTKHIEFQAKLQVDPRFWLPGKPIKVRTAIGIPEQMPFGEYELFLSLPDPEPKLSARAEYMIQLANEGLWDGGTGRHKLRQKLKVLPEKAPAEEKPAISFYRVL